MRTALIIHLQLFKMVLRCGRHYFYTFYLNFKANLWLSFPTVKHTHSLLKSTVLCTFPDIDDDPPLPHSGLRKSLSKKRSEKHRKRSMNKRCDSLPIIQWCPHFVYFHPLFFIFFELLLLRVSTSGDLLDLPAGISPSGSVSSMPSCLPFPWFSERGREKEVDGGRERLRSVSSSSLPYLTTTGRRDQVRRWGNTSSPKKWDLCKPPI